MFLVAYHIIGFVLLLTCVSRPQASLAFNLAWYYLFPFGKFIGRVPSADDVHVNLEEGTEEKGEKSPILKERKPRGLCDNITPGDVIWWTLVAVPMAIVHLIVACISWFFIITIPMAKLNFEATRLLFRRPRSLAVWDTAAHIRGELLLCSYSAANAYYFKYSVFGVSIVFVNLLPFDLIALFLGWVIPDYVSDVPKFIICLIAIIPLAYFIGAAVSSISAQSTFAVGAVLNATFGSIVELILYFNAMSHNLFDMVRAAVSGSLLGCMLLLPGLAMLVGGVKHRDQRFNATAAGVGSTLLFISIIGAFTPTMFYNVFGQHELNCGYCVPHSENSTALACIKCHYSEIEMDTDPLYHDRVRPLMYVCAGVLPLAYLVGLLYSLKTHTHIYEAPTDGDGPEGHEGPEWSRLVCVIILLASTAAFALISETLVDTFHPFLQYVQMPELFAGMTVIALVPNIAEFVNAIQFALQDNISLSIEIGSSASVQISLIQIPVLVLLSAIFDQSKGTSFTLIFPTMTLFVVLLAVFIFNYLLIDGKASYFQGAVLVLVWVMMLAAFWFVPPAAQNTLPV